jgi:hyperosmotically inducible periplasmic protein
MRLLITSAFIATAALAAACNRAPNEPTVGQQVDTAIAKGADTTKDVALTASIKTELARDPTLSALSINVDTNEGRVSLRGKAPDAAAVERATAIARATQGVVSVDNQLVVESRTN